MDEEDKAMIVALEDSILKGHLDGDPKTKTHSCRYCFSKNNWHVSVLHTPTCPVSLIREIRIKNNIPNWLDRVLKG